MQDLSHTAQPLTQAVAAIIYLVQSLLKFIPPHPLTGRSISTQLFWWAAVTMAVCGHPENKKVRKRKGIAEREKAKPCDPLICTRHW